MSEVAGRVALKKLFEACSFSEHQKYLLNKKIFTCDG